jgi:mannonate dehydratase
MTMPRTDRARIGLGPVNRITDDVALVAHQLGAPHVGLWPSRWLEERPGAGARWTVAELAAARRACEERGLVLEYIGPHNYIRAMLGLPGGDEQIEQCIETIRAMGATGIRVLDYFWAPNGAWRTTFTEQLRPGATTNGFDMAEVERAGNVLRNRMMRETGAYTDSYAQVFELADDVVVTEEDLWKTYERFLRAVLPEAERAGVLLSVHPSDPPAPMLGGIGRMLRSPDHYRRAMALADSPAWGVLACLGSISEMPGGAANVFEMIDTFGSIGKIGLVHFRDVEGSFPKFRETFPGEGNYDPFLVMRRLLEVGYTGVIVEDHYPVLAGDSGTPDGVVPNVRAKAHAIGTLQGLLRAARTSLDEGRVPEPIRAT